MTYSIPSVQVSEATGRVISADWRYSTEHGVLSSIHVFETPAGDLPPEQITEAVLIDWLKAQSSQSEEEMAASLAAEHQRRVEAAAVVSTSLNGQSVAGALAEQKRLQEEARLAAAAQAALLKEQSASGTAGQTDPAHPGGTQGPTP